MGPEEIILVNPPITTFQQSLTHSALVLYLFGGKQLTDKPTRVYQNYIGILLFKRL